MLMTAELPQGQLLQSVCQYRLPRGCETKQPPARVQWGLQEISAGSERWTPMQPCHHQGWQPRAAPRGPMARSASDFLGLFLMVTFKGWGKKENKLTTVFQNKKEGFHILLTSFVDFFSL